MQERKQRRRNRKELLVNKLKRKRQKDLPVSRLRERNKSVLLGNRPKEKSRKDWRESRLRRKKLRD